MLIFHQIAKLLGGKCACIQTLYIKWIENASKYCTPTLISSLNIEYEIVLRTPYFKFFLVVARRITITPGQHVKTKENLVC